MSDNGKSYTIYKQANRIKELEKAIEKLDWISCWLCENVEYKKFNEVLEWRKETDALLKELEQEASK
tara:strand:+ start:1140 stop:1340 length:201 start_codon:yes stop_codon:yes gene_type:complete